MHHSIAHHYATRWIPLWCLLLALMSPGVQATSDTCNINQCSTNRLAHAIPCDNAVTSVTASVIATAIIGVLPLPADRHHYPDPTDRLPSAPVSRIERPPCLLA